MLGLLGIAAGSAVVSSGVKSAKDGRTRETISASNEADKPRFMQVFLVEEGTFADKVIDAAKFQGFIATVVVLAAYVALAIRAIDDAGSVAELTSLPDFSPTFLTLLGISQGAYVLGKVPDKAGVPQGMTVERLDEDPDLRDPEVSPRNPR